MNARLNTDTVVKRPVRPMEPLADAVSARSAIGSGRGLTVDPRTSVLLACVLTFLLHLLFLSRELGSDEGGFAMVARSWRSAGPYLYGNQWVDRPPGLMLVFEAAHALGPFGVRLMAGIAATVLVAAAAWAAGVVRGAGAAEGAAWTAFALAASPLLGSYQLDGEIVAAPFVMVSVAALLHALYRTPSTSHWVILGVFSGAAAASALLMKQNFADGLVFAGVLLASSLVLRRFPRGRVVGISVAFLVGATGPIVGALLWASAHGGVPALMYATYGFRADATAVIAGWSWDAPRERLLQLVGIACASGIVLLGVHLLLNHRRVLVSRSPLVWAVAAAAGLELFGLVSGENYWPHYLVALIPMLAFAAGLGSTIGAPGRTWTRRLIVLAVATTLLAAPIGAFVAHGYRSHPYLTGRWLAVSSERGDTVVVPFSHANVIEASGLSSPYPYSWSLPVRTLDPDLNLLTHTLDRRLGAPTWVVRWDDPHTWGLDPDDRVANALAAHYRQVAVVCGHPVWLHRGVRRSLVPTPDGCSDNPSAIDTL